MTSPSTNRPRPPIIFLGNGPLADYALAALQTHFDIIFHAKTASDLAKVRALKTQNPQLQAVLASFGVIIKQDLLALFEPTGIINLHPSLLPKYRGASPIESAILNGDTALGISIMKLSPQMDAGPLYHQASLDFSALLDPYQPASQALSSYSQDFSPNSSSMPDAAAVKYAIYHALATTGAEWLTTHLLHLPAPVAQSGPPTFCAKLDKSLSNLLPDATEIAPGQLKTAAKTAPQLHREIIAYAIYPRSKIVLGGHETLILASHIANPSETPLLSITASDGRILSLDRIQPAGKNPMDPKSFQNGYLR